MPSPPLRNPAWMSHAGVSSGPAASSTARSRRWQTGPARLWIRPQFACGRLTDAACRLRSGLPVVGFAARDPWGLRAALTIFLLLGAVDARGDWGDRLLRAITPVL